MSLFLLFACEKQEAPQPAEKAAPKVKIEPVEPPTERAIEIDTELAPASSDGPTTGILSDKTEAPVHVFGDESFIREWLLCGEFPNPPHPGAQYYDHTGQCIGLDRDYLTTSGGEVAARPVPGMIVPHPDGSEREWIYFRSPADTVDFLQVYPEGPHDNVVSYGYVRVQSDETTTAILSLSSDDGCRYWWNGEMVYEVIAGRGVQKDSDMIPVQIEKGINHLLIKTEQGWGGWGLAGRVLSPAQALAVKGKGVVTGKVMQQGPEGEWLPADRARVSFHHRAYPYTWTDSRGYFELWGLPVKDLTVGARKDNLVAKTVKVEAAPVGLKAGPAILYLQQGAALLGAALDSENGEPLAGVQVEVKADGRKPVKTDEAGNFMVTGLLPQRCEVEASHPGYAAARHLVDIEDGENLVMFHLEKGADLYVLVTDEAGNLLEKISLNLQSEGNHFGHKQTDAQGKARFEALSRNGMYMVQASGKGYQYQRKNVPPFLEDQAATTVTITMQPRPEDERNQKAEPGYFEGQVTDKDGLPLEGIQVKWLSPWELRRNQDKTATVTDTSGWYRLEVPNRNEARRNLYAFSDVYAAQTKRGIKAGDADKPTRVDFEMEKGKALFGQVVDVEGRPLADVEVFPMPYQTSYYHNGFPNHKEQKTDQEGRFRFENIPSPGAQLRLKKAGYSTLDRFPAPLEKEVRIEMQVAGVIRGQVVDDESGEPVVDFVVKLSGAEDYELNRQGQKVLDEEGRFQVDDLSVTRQCHLTIEAPGYAAKSWNRIFPQLPEEAEETVYRLNSGTWAEIRVVDGQTKAPVSGVRVISGSKKQHNHISLQWDNLNNLYFLDNRNNGATDGEGLCQLDLLKEKAVVILQHDDYAGQLLFADDLKKYADTSGIYEIPLSQGGGIYGRVEMDGVPQAGKRIRLQGQSSRRGTSVSFNYGSNNTLQTDSYGTYRTERLSPATYRVQVVMDGESNYTESQSVEVGEAEMKEVNFLDEADQVSLSGKVLDGQTGVAGVHLNFNLQGSGNSGDNHIYLQTDENGEYAIKRMSKGTYRVNLSKYDNTGTQYPHVQDEVELSEADNVKDFQYLISQKITGRLAYPEGYPLQERYNYVNLSAEAPQYGTRDSKSPQNHGSTRLQGEQFEINGFFQGKYQMQFSRPADQNGIKSHYMIKHLELNNEQGNQDMGVIEIPFAGNARVSLTVMETADIPIPECQIFLQQMETDRAFSFYGNTDDQGNLVLSHVRPGTYRVSITDRSGKFGSTSLVNETIEVTGDLEKTWTLGRTYEVTARFVDPEDPERILSYQNIFLRRVSPAQGEEGILASGTGKMDGNEAVWKGRFKGQYTIQMIGENFQDGLTLPDPVEVDNLEGDQDLGTIVLPSTGKVLVRITEGADLTGPHCMVFFQSVSNPENMQNRAFAEGETEQNFEGVPAGKYLLNIFSETCQGPTRLPLTVTAGEVTEVEVQLKPNQMFMGMFRVEQGVLSGDSPPPIKKVTITGNGQQRELLQEGQDISMNNPFAIYGGGRDTLTGNIFVLQNLPAGTYTVTIEAEGFHMEPTEFVKEEGKVGHTMIPLVQD